MSSNTFTPSEVTFRFTRDAELVTLLNEQVHTLHHRNHPDIFAPYNFETFLPVFEKTLQQQNTYCIIAYVLDKPVGYALMEHIRRGEKSPMLANDYHCLQIDEMAILDGYRQQGVGRAMITFIREFCRKKDIPRIQLSVWAENENARAFYEKTGFKEYLLYLEMKV